MAAMWPVLALAVCCGTALIATYSMHIPAVGSWCRHVPGHGHIQQCCSMRSSLMHEQSLQLG
jgi:hypothetical protein